ncbi:MAG TPA: cytochrome P460 family protein [Blastocatellia bacterium]|nr:cytochrome P460 family protein [Blastocatellia bacterium]
MHTLTKRIVLVGYLCTAIYVISPGFLKASHAQTGQQATVPRADMTTAQCPDAKESSLPLPSSMSPDDFHDKLLAFLQNIEYVKLKWCVDKGVRDTGPYVNDTYLGVHPAVRVYYSPAIMTWLVNGRISDIPDGAMIVKEMYKLGPAARYEGKHLTPESWTVMIKDSKGSKDGWFWGGLWTSTPPMPKPSDGYKAPFNVADEGFGLPCLHCHASSEKESTFASLNNIKGFQGNPLSYFIDNSWRDAPTLSITMAGLEHVAPGHKKKSASRKTASVEMATDGEFLRLFGVSSPGKANVQAIPPETYDHIVAGPGGAEEFVTSDQCMMCHSGNAWYGEKFIMILEGKSKNPVNVSPYGEWRWSPMGLAGRDPIFYAQLDSELAYLKDRKDDQQKLINTCFRCHGVMGKRQLDRDHGYDPAAQDSKVPEPNFKLDFVYNTNLTDKDFKYGALARDGVSCGACHHIVQDKTPPGQNALQYFLAHSITGQFKIGKPTELFGPFEDNTVSPHPMKESLGIDPKYDAYIKDSRMCGSCHTINLPVMDQKPFGHSLEQVTYLEWVNSQYQTDFKPGPNAKSCQDCHMASGYANKQNNVDVKQIQTAFADVQDDTYPAAENLAPMEDVRARFRDKGFVRHQLQGLNVFLLEMFNQFMAPDASKTPNYSNDILGVRKSDYMSTLNNDLPNAILNFVQAARYETASIEVTQPAIANQRISADVTITNWTGHRFPSGVGFRRAVIEFDVLDNSVVDPRTGQPKVVWSSGRINDQGFIVDKDGNILDTEYLGTNRNKKGPAQPHFYKERPISNSKQVQIYEELMKDSEGNFTTSFIRRDTPIKDNRLLPIGWSKEGPDPASLSGDYLHSTYPEGDALNDPVYKNGKGMSVVRYEIPLSELPRGTDLSRVTVKATLYYQSIPPYYLMQRFEQAPNAPGTQRLLYLTSRLNTKGTPIEGWRLLIASSPVMIPKRN